MKRTKVYVSALTPPVVRELEIEKGETLKLEVDWSAPVGEMSTSLSSSAWATDVSGVVTLSGATTSTNLVSSLCAGTEVGTVLITNTATLANGVIREQKFRVTVIDT